MSQSEPIIINEIYNGMPIHINWHQDILTIMITHEGINYQHSLHYADFQQYGDFTLIEIKDIYIFFENIIISKTIFPQHIQIKLNKICEFNEKTNTDQTYLHCQMNYTVPYFNRQYNISFHLLRLIEPISSTNLSQSTMLNKTNSDSETIKIIQQQLIHLSKRQDIYDKIACIPFCSARKKRADGSVYY